MVLAAAVRKLEQKSIAARGPLMNLSEVKTALRFFSLKL